jgi:hypothetical protein
MAFNSNEGKNSFTASASQTDFIFNFKIFAVGDIKVFLTPAGQSPDDTADILTITTDYTVVIDGDNGGTVTLVVPASENDTIVIRRELADTRTISYVTQGDLLAVTLNTDQDYQTYLIMDSLTKISESLTLPESTVGVSTKLPAVVADSYIKWNAAADALENDTTIPDNVLASEDSNLEAASWANEDEDVAVKEYTNGVPSDRSPTVYSAKHWEIKSQDKAWESEAEQLTANSYAVQVEDTFVNTYTSDGDGTFTATPTTDYSALHWAAKAATFNPSLYALLTGATFTGQVKGITPVANEDLTRKDYVDTGLSGKLSSLLGALDINNYLHIQDQKASGTDGGSSVAGIQDRDLNTVIENNISGASLAANEITLPSGDYYIEASSTVFDVNFHKLYITNDSNTKLLFGSTQYNGSVDSQVSLGLVSGKITLASTTDIKLRQYTGVATATSGLGLASSLGEAEIYSDIKIWKVA